MVVLTVLGIVLPLTIQNALPWILGGTLIALVFELSYDLTTLGRELDVLGKENRGLDRRVAELEPLEERVQNLEARVSGEDGRRLAGKRLVRRKSEQSERVSSGAMKRADAVVVVVLPP